MPGCLRLSDPSTGIPRIGGSALDSHGCSYCRVSVQDGGKLTGQADAAVRGRPTRSRDRTSMETDAGIGQPHEVGHRCTLETSSFRDGINHDCGVSDYQITVAVIDFSVAVRTFLCNLLGDPESSHRCRSRTHAGGYRSPADLVGSGVEGGLLLVDVDLDAGDFASVSLPLIKYFRLRFGRWYGYCLRGPRLNDCVH